MKHSYYSWFAHQLDEWSLARLRARDERREKARLRLEAYQLRLEKEEDQKEEIRMTGMGFVRCSRCSFYSDPNLMLDMVSVASPKAAADFKCFTPEDLEEPKQLILNTDKRKPRVPADFRKFRAVFVCIETPRRCKSMHT